MRQRSLKRGCKAIKGTFSVQTKYGAVESVPVIGWEALIPYWPSICRAIFEVLIENDFYPYAATLKRPDGFVASKYYWEISLNDPIKVPLSEAKFFIYKIKEKTFFLSSIREFNQKTRTNWLEEENIATLGGYLNSFFFALKPVLKAVGKGRAHYLKPLIKQKL
jgi:hypothetical protein